MKRFIYFLLCVLPLTVLSQNSYFDGEDWIVVNEQQSDELFTIPTDKDFNTIAKSSLTEDSIKLKRLSHYGFLVSSNHKNILRDAYFSKIYYTSTCNRVMVLPYLMVSIKENCLIAPIIEKFKNSLELEELDKLGIYIFKCITKNSDDVLRIAHEISSLPYVQWCEPDLLRPLKLYNTYYSDQYYLKNTGQNNGTEGIDINIENAWDITTGSSTIKVAVIDEGVDNDHEDLYNAVLIGYTCKHLYEIGAPIHPTTSNPKSHGMACAGIIAARDNNIGIVGVAPNSQIIPINIFSDYEPENIVIDSYDIKDAIEWAVDHGADVLSMSWGYDDSPYINQAINHALTEGRNGKGCILVAAAGNSTDPTYMPVDYPANKNGVIAVGAVDKNGNRCYYSCYGNYLDLMAPSGDIDNNGDIVTLDRMGTLGYNNTNYFHNFGGTSAACPQVAGVAALMLSVNPELTYQEVEYILCHSARDLGTTGYDQYYGWGLVDAEAAVKAASLTPKINGKITLTGTNYYSISGVPSTYDVEWETTGSLHILSVDSDTRGCLVNSLSTNTSGNLKAYITSNGQRVRELSRPITNSMYASFKQDACTFMGVNHPSITMNNCSLNSHNYVHQGCLVTIYSSYFKGVDINTGGLTPTSFSFNGNNQITFALPNISGVPFFIYINGTMSTREYQLEFFPIINNGNLQASLVVEPSSEGFRLHVIDIEDIQLQTLNESGTNCAPRQSSVNDLHIIEVFNETSPILRDEFSGDIYELNTNGWASGIYYVRVYTNGQIVNTKLIVN